MGDLNNRIKAGEEGWGLGVGGGLGAGGGLGEVGGWGKRVGGIITYIISDFLDLIEAETDHS